MTQTIAADINIEKGLNLAYAANAEFDTNGHSEEFEAYFHDEFSDANLIAKDGLYIAADMRRRPEGVLPRLAACTAKEKAQAINEIQKRLLANFVEGMHQDELLESGYPGVVEPKDVVRVFMLDLLGNELYRTRGEIVHRVLQPTAQPERVESAEPILIPSSPLVAA